MIHRPLGRSHTVAFLAHIGVAPTTSFDRHGLLEKVGFVGPWVATAKAGFAGSKRAYPSLPGASSRVASARYRSL